MSNVEQVIEQVAIADLIPYAQNARTHSPRQISQMAVSINTFGFINSILIDAENHIIAGHGRVEAAKKLGMTHVPAVRVTHLTDVQRRAYILADNKLAQLAGWDEDILAIELQFLTDEASDFSVEVTGFSTAEIDLKLDDAAAKPARLSKHDKIPPLEAAPVSRVGDLWRIGDHALYCGDARDRESFDRLMGVERARMVFVDPPYNVPIDGHAGGNGAAPRREFLMASGEMDKEEFTTLLRESIDLLIEYSEYGSIHYIAMDWRHLPEVLNAGGGYEELKNLVVWNKNNAGMGTFYRSQHELILVFKKHGAAHVNNFGLGESGRYRTNVWSYPAMNSFGRGRDEALAMHPTVKPVGLVADAIRDVSRRREIVLDSFAGSGTTGIAAHKTQRRARLIELDPRYVDVIIKRFDSTYGLKATLADTAETFADVAARRAQEAA